MKTIAKNSLLAVCCILGFYQLAPAQAFRQGSTIMSVGYGIGNLHKTLFTKYSHKEGYSTTSLGPLFGKFEYGVSDHMGFGIAIAHIGVEASYNTDKGYRGKINFRNTSVLGRINIHFAKNDKLDAYWGAGLGYRFGKWKYQDTDPKADKEGEIPSIVPFGFETTIGFRYFVVSNIGVYAELGIAKAPVQFGLTAKF